MSSVRPPSTATSLGLRLSDRSADIIAFLHGPHASDHHVLAFAKSNAPGLHHSSWDVGSLDEVGLGAELMKTHGYTKGWGVGRHVLGSNYFYYVQDPWGSWAEYSFDIDFVPADVEWPAGRSSAGRFVLHLGTGGSRRLRHQSRAPGAALASGLARRFNRGESMRFVAFKRDGGQPGLGLRVDQELVDLTALGLPVDVEGTAAPGRRGARGRESSGRARENADGRVRASRTCPLSSSLRRRLPSD